MPFPYTKQTWTDGVSDATGARLTVIENGIAQAGVIGTSSTPPGSPVDGMIWRLPASTSLGTYWFFQYDSSQTTNKWVFMGGPPWVNQVDTSQTTASTTYAALATAGPSIAIPRAGDYLVEIGCRSTNSGAATIIMSYDIGGTGAVDADGEWVDITATAQTHSGARASVKALTAVTLTSKYRVTAGTGTFANRWMKVTPIRII